MTNHLKQGREFQRAIASYLREQGLDVELSTTPGDRLAGLPLAVEMSGSSTSTMAVALDTAQATARAGRGKLPAAIVRRRGHDDPADQYAVVSLQTLAALAALAWPESVATTPLPPLGQKRPRTATCELPGCDQVFTTTADNRKFCSVSHRNIAQKRRDAAKVA